MVTATFSPKGSWGDLTFKSFEKASPTGTRDTGVDVELLAVVVGLRGTSGVAVEDLMGNNIREEARR